MGVVHCYYHGTLEGAEGEANLHVAASTCDGFRALIHTPDAGTLRIQPAPGHLALASTPGSRGGRSSSSSSSSSSHGDDALPSLQGSAAILDQAHIVYRLADVDDNGKGHGRCGLTHSHEQLHPPLRRNDKESLQALVKDEEDDEEEYGDDHSDHIHTDTHTHTTPTPTPTRSRRLASPSLPLRGARSLLLRSTARTGLSC